MRKKRIIPLILVLLSMGHLLAQDDSVAIRNFELNKWKLSPILATKIEKAAIEFPQQFSIEVSELQVLNELFEKTNCYYKIIDQHLRINALQIEVENVVCLDILINCPVVTFVHLLSTRRKVESRVRNMNLNVNKVNLLHHFHPDIDGSDIVISVKEPHYDTTDLDLKGRHIPSELGASNITSHPTDMATIVAGAGNSAVTGKGVAIAASLSSSNFEALFPDPTTSYQELGISIQNHSYGTEIENFYGLLAKAYDVSCNDNPELVHIFSVGNMGFEMDSLGPFNGVSGFANLTGNFKMAKNILTVAFLNASNEMDPGSSKGPAYDGRIKPELSAYSLDGSSNAAALTSGVVALMQQSYKNIHNVLPSSSLIKAVLLNSAEDISSPGPDFNSGFGNLNSFRALSCIEQGHYMEGLITNNESLSFDLEIPSNKRDLKVTLSWNDPAANIMANTALVNDLNLQVEHVTSGSEWQPWILNPHPHFDSLNLPAKRGSDHLNNIEQVSLAFPDGGYYRITVDAGDLVGDLQTFFIAYQWDEKEQFQWTFPSGSDNIPQDGETLTAFRWETTYEGKTGKLEFRHTNNNNWQLIEDQLDLSKEYFFWDAPEISSTYIARMSIDNQVYTTDTFTISRPLKIKIGFNCTDSVFFSWAPVSNAIGYTLFSMGDKYLYPIQETVDTFAVIHKQTYPQSHFTVAPQLGPSRLGIKSLTINYKNQPIGCYILSFSASTIPDEGVNLLLELGTTYEVKELSFEKFIDGAFSSTHSTSSFSRRYQFVDSSPLEGLNIYRAKIYLSDGTEIYSTPDSVYYLKKQDFLVFPNPLTSSSELKVFTRFFDNELLQFQLFNTSGHLVYQQELDNEYNFLSLPRLSQGIYFYFITAPDLLFAEKLLIH